MRVLIVESDPGLAWLWRRHLERMGGEVQVAASQAEAVEVLSTAPVRVIVMNLVLGQGSAFAVADFASYRRPEARVIFVTDTSFFSDGSIFNHIPNACALLQSPQRAEDLAAMVEHYGAAR